MINILRSNSTAFGVIHLILLKMFNKSLPFDSLYSDISDGFEIGSFVSLFSPLSSMLFIRTASFSSSSNTLHSSSSSQSFLFFNDLF
ncbi:hypothetical protein RIR_jg31445.t1 [Rhizophagus irregularis DAOM 181602=DAOM 197198]|nr:hypothetical protein RIR_jg31445.t1 [Rhizophagus irregularis DAOM 181602=DAOM 197198]